MSDIKVDDRVQWRPKYRQKKTPEIMTGVVRSIHNGRKPWAGIAVTEPRGGNWCVDLDRLTVINEAHELQLEAAYIAHDAAAAVPCRGPSEEIPWTVALIYKREPTAAEIAYGLQLEAELAARSDTEAIAALGVICTDYEAQREALADEL